MLQLSSGISSADLCSVGVMNNLLADSLGVSLGAGFDHMSCLSFSLKFRPQALNQSGRVMLLLQVFILGNEVVICRHSCFGLSRTSLQGQVIMLFDLLT